MTMRARDDGVDAVKLTKAQKYALAYYAAAEDGTPRPAKRWDAKQSPRWDVVDKLRAAGLIQQGILRLTTEGRSALASGTIDKPLPPKPTGPPEWVTTTYSRGRCARSKKG